jgi:PAS domain S-box-containing protein
MANDLRKSGIDTVGDIPWGTHFCHFYENKSDLLDVLVPYFKRGLEQNEFCVWGVFDPLDKQQARDALERALPGADARLAAGDIEIVPQSQWYRGDGVNDLQQLVRDWEAKLEKALARGCAGMRVNVNAAWLVERDPRNLDAYEDEFSGLIANRRMILLCAYPLAVNHAAEIFDAGYTHRFAIARRHGNWQVVETPELRQARANMKRLNAELERRAIERTEELATADKERRQESAARHQAEQALRASGERSLCYFELGLVGMAIVSPAQGCIEVNQRLCEILGYERRELVHMTWSALAHPDDLAGDIRNYDRILAGEVEGYLMPKRWIRKNGAVVHTNVSVKCQRREDGSVNYFAAMVEEVTGLDQSGAADPVAAGETRPHLHDHNGPMDYKDLSRRERQVARLIGLGRTVKEIAAMLLLSEKTVSTYRRRVLTKLKLKSTSELIRYALKNDLAE